MKAIIHRFHSPDVFDLDSYAPDDPTDDAILLQIMVGPVGEDSEESFDVLVCTPRRLERLVESDGPIVGRHYLIVKSMDYSIIRRYLTSAIERESADNWEDLAARIGRIGKSEFEDYVEYDKSRDGSS